MVSPSPDLWRDRDFRRFWVGETISLFGSEVTALALPLTAALVLEATPGQMGILAAMSFLPFLLISLPVGAWIDRRRRRPVMLAANLGRAVLIALVPVTALTGTLRIELLFAIALATGILTVFFDLSFLSFVPSLVEEPRLVEANTRVLASHSAAAFGGPALAGVLVSLLGAPLALLADAASFVVSAGSLHLIRRSEAPPPSTVSQHLGREIRDGLRVTLGNPILRTFAFEAATYNVFSAAFSAVLLLYATRELSLSPAVIGGILSVAALGSLAGSVVASRLGVRFGIGRTIVAASVMACSAPVLVPLATGPMPVVIVMVTAAFFIEGAGVMITVVHVMTVRQTITPAELLGRMNATYKTVTYGAIPVGALLGGLLGEAFGLQPTLLIASLGIMAAPLWYIASPVPSLGPREAGTDSTTVLGGQAA